MGAMPEPRECILLEYAEPSGRIPFREWLEELREKRVRAAIDARLLRVRLGNFGDARPVGSGVEEMRVHVGPGYRVYFARDGDQIVLLLIAGEKRAQTKDIKAAKQFWANYKEE